MCLKRGQGRSFRSVAGACAESRSARLRWCVHRMYIVHTKKPPTPRRPVNKTRCNLRLDAPLVEAADRYATDYAISRSAAVSLALAEFLRRQGYLPPATAEDDEKR